MVYALILSLSSAAGIKTQLVIRDLAQTCDTALGVGLISSIGYLLWLASAAVALFTCSAGRQVIQPRERELLGLGGSFSLVLCIDDMFLLHDRYIGATFLYVVYAVFALLILFRYRSTLINLNGHIFFISACLLGTSVVIDEIQREIPMAYETTQLFEEGAKFLGISIWLLFWWIASSTILRQGLRKKRELQITSEP